MKKHICVINTSFSNKDDIYRLFREKRPDWRINYIGDDSLIQDMIKNGAPTPAIISRMSKYAMAAVEMGADAIINQCSSVGEVADVYEKLVPIPVFKIDQAMASKAVELGSRISLVATVATTVGPSRRLIESTAAKLGKKVEVKECLVDGAMEVLFAGDPKRHNEMVKEMVEREDGQCDVIVLAQGSMLVLVPELTHIKTPVLTSIPMGVEAIIEEMSK